MKEYALQGLRPIATVLPSETSAHLLDAAIVCYQLDVTLEESVKELKKKVMELTDGYLDVLVNNAWVLHALILSW